MAAISRYASALDGLARELAQRSGVRSASATAICRTASTATTPASIDYFTTAYFHRPEDLRQEMLEAAEFDDVKVLGVEGAGWMVADFDARWADPVMREDLLATARAFESEPSMLGVSAHLLGIGRKKS